MADNVYLLKVAVDVQADLKTWLCTKTDPSHVRVATLSPLSNYGYPPGAEGALLNLNAQGLVFGIEGNDDIPRAFIPWQNVSYISDGSSLAKKREGK